MICKYCGKTIKDASKFCLYCGQKVEEQSSAPVRTGREEQSSTPVATGREEQSSAPVRTGREEQSSAPVVTGREEQLSATVGTEREFQASTPSRMQKEKPSNAQGAKKKKHKAPIVAAVAMIAIAVVAVVAVVAVRFFQPEPSRPSNGDENQNAAVSLTPEPSRPSDRDQTKNEVASSTPKPSPTSVENETQNTPSLTPEPTQPDNSALFQASASELLTYVDQAEQMSLEVYERIETIFESDNSVAAFQKAVELSEELLNDLLSMQQQAAAVSGIGAGLENAGKEYFNMLCDSQRAYYELWRFAADYMGFYVNYMLDRPTTDDYYSEPDDFYDLLYAWYLSVQEEYSAITSCPACMEDTWKRYGDALELNFEIAYRMYEGDMYYDRLRILSAMCMSNRFVTVHDLLFDEIVGCLDGEENHLLRQIEAASELVEEMHAYAKMGEAERGGYEFQCIRTGEVSVSYSAIDTIYPSLYNSYDAFVVIKTGCISGTKRVVVEAEIEGLTQTYKDTITLDSAYREIRIKPPALTGDLDLSLGKSGQIRVSISASDGTWREEKTFPIEIKSKYDFELYNDEYGAATRDNLLCFLTPEAMELAQLERQAAVEISNMTNGQLDSFVGYQETGWNHYTGTYLQAAGIMRALNVMGIKYINGAFSLSEGSHQHILFPKDVLREQGGLCIETALLVASTLQRAGMHAYILLPPGHAQVAVEIWNGSGNDITGTGEYFLIETTALSDSWNNQNVFVADANALVSGKVLNESPIVYYNEQGWYQYIQEYDPYIIDCNDSKVFGMMPFAN